MKTRKKPSTHKLFNDDTYLLAFQDNDDVREHRISKCTCSLFFIHSFVVGGVGVVKDLELQTSLPQNIIKITLFINYFNKKYEMKHANKKICKNTPHNVTFICAVHLIL